MLSVIIPVYNAEEFIRPCLDSILTEQDVPLEVICVDDCSTDSTPSILHEYTQKYPNVHVLRNEENIFAGRSRNRGLEKACGRYVHFMDADDYVIPHVYKDLLPILTDNDLDWLKASCEAVDLATGEHVTNYKYEISKMSPQFEEVLLDFHDFPDKMLKNISVVPWNGIYKRSFLLDNNIRFNSLRCNNDHSLYLEICVRGKRMMFTRKPLARHRVNNSQSLVGGRIRNFEVHFESYRITRTLCDEAGVSPRVRAALLGNCLSDMLYWYGTVPEESELKGKIAGDIREFLGTEVNIEDFYCYRRTDWLIRRLEPLGLSIPQEFMLKIDGLLPPVAEGTVSVSVVVPVCGDGTHLSRCLASILGQSLTSLEVLCVDTGESRKASAIAAHYAAKDDRVRILPCEKVQFLPGAPDGDPVTAPGYGAAINTGIRAAAGKYIGIVRPVDFIAEDFYEFMYKKVSAAGPEVDFVLADYYDLLEAPEEKGSSKKAATASYMRVRRPVSLRSATYAHPIYLGKVRGLRFPMLAGNGLYRRSFLQENQIRFNEAYSRTMRDDSFCCARTLMGKTVLLEGHPAYYRRALPVSTVSDRTEMMEAERDYHYILELLFENQPSAWGGIRNVYWKARYDQAHLMMQRLDDDLRPEFARHLQDRFYRNKGQLSRPLMTREKWNAVQLLLKDPDRYAASFRTGDGLPETDALHASFESHLSDSYWDARRKVKGMVPKEVRKSLRKALKTVKK